MTGGNMILMARRRARLTQRDLASRLGCRQATIARWERGDRQPAFQDVQDVVGACGLQLDAHLLPEDRSWWPQIAAQLERTPVERVRQLAPPAAFGDVVAVLEALAETRVPVIVIGELAGALHGWPLVLSDGPIEVCAREQAVGAIRQRLSAADADVGAYALASDRRLAITETPAATSGYGDLARGAETVKVDGGTVQVAGLLDLLRIADASPDPDARRHALAYGAVLDVQRARGELRTADGRSDQERIQAWLSEQIPVA
jgi:transcriptional regulator with XRE-family HTH domain